jgi:hypothetical protein
MGEAAGVASGTQGTSIGLNRRARVVRWSLAILVALLVHGAALFLLDLPRDIRAERPGHEAPVTFLSVDPDSRASLLQEQLEFADTAPLYFPTQWNVANAENIRLPLKSPGDIFESYPARLAESAVTAEGLVGLPLSTITSAPEALARFQPDFTRVAGQVDRIIVPLATRFAMVEIFNLSDGAKVYETAVPAGESVQPLSGVDWRPAEWVVLIDAVGEIGNAMMTRSSGSDSVDDVLQAMVDMELDLGRQLAPGYYTVLVGP